VAAIVMLAACGTRVVVPLYPAHSINELAQATGRLEIHGRCLLIVDSEEDAWTVAWPTPGTLWNANTGTISLRGVQARVGDTVTLGGGEPHLTSVGAGWVTPPAPECIRVPVWYASSMTK
jgi:hypothetical protein